MYLHTNLRQREKFLCTTTDLQQRAIRANTTKTPPTTDMSITTKNTVLEPWQFSDFSFFKKFNEIPSFIGGKGGGFQYVILYFFLVFGLSERPTACRQTEMAVTDRNRQETEKPISAHLYVTQPVRIVFFFLRYNISINISTIG